MQRFASSEQNSLLSQLGQAVKPGTLIPSTVNSKMNCWRAKCWERRLLWCSCPGAALLCAQRGESFSPSPFTSSSPLPFCFPLSNLFYPFAFPFLFFLFPFSFFCSFSLFSVPFPFFPFPSGWQTPPGLPAEPSPSQAGATSPLLEGLIEVPHTQTLLCQGLALLV